MPEDSPSPNPSRKREGNSIVFHLARADNGVIGRDGTLPWRIPRDLQRFKQGTMGRPMIMGRKTFESFAAMLEGRRHIVLTRDPDWQAEGAEVAHDVDNALTLAGTGEIAVIGGAQIYAQFLPLADRIEVTEVHAAPEGDAVVPAFDPTDWRETKREAFAATDTAPAFDFVTLKRR